MLPPSSNPIVAYRFGPFRLIVDGRILERNDDRVPLTPKVIDTLFVFVENPRQIVTKELLMKQVWPDVNVVESGITRNISALRKALEAGLPEGSILETVPRRGYRFLADVTIENESPLSEPPPAEVPPPVDAPVPRRQWHRSAVIVGVALPLLLTGWFSFRPAAAPPTSMPEPEVRIGEHLLAKAAPEESLRAEQHFERAIATNRQSAGGHAGLAAALIQSSMFGLHPVEEILPRAEELAQRAISLDERSGMAYFAIGLIHVLKDWNFPAAKDALRRSLEFEPRLVQAWIGQSRVHIALGELPEAQRSLEAALRLDPASPQLGADYCQLFYLQRDFRRGELECRKVLEREPGYGLANYYLALCLGMMGRIDEAEITLAKASVPPGVLEADRAWLSLLRGDRRPAAAVLETRRQSIRQNDMDASAKLLLAAILHHHDEAIEAIEAGIARRSPDLLTLSVEPRLDSLRGDPRYLAALHRMGIAPVSSVTLGKH